MIVSTLLAPLNNGQLFEHHSVKASQYYVLLLASMLIQYAQLYALMCTCVTRFNLVFLVSHAFNGGVINLLQFGETLIIFRHEAAYMKQTFELIFPPESKIRTILIKHKNIFWKLVRMI